MGELHLEVSVEKLMRTPGVKVTVGRPQVAYRQTLSKAVEIETRYIKQSGGRGKFAVIYMRYEPLTKEQVDEWTTYQEEQGDKPDPNNLYFMDKIVGGVVPGEYIPSVEAGFRDACVKGAKYGFQCVDMQATLLDGKYHDVDSSQDAFKLAAMECTRDAQIKAGITLAGADHERGGAGPGAVPRRSDARHQPSPRRDPQLQHRTRAAASCTLTCRWPSCSATPASCATSRAARRRSAWSRATTLRSRKNWPTCAWPARQPDTVRCKSEPRTQRSGVSG